MQVVQAGVLMAVLTTAVSSGVAAQEEGRWLVRGRGIVLVPNASSRPSGLDVKASATIEIGITRYLSPVLALELDLATASHEVMAGSNSLGSVSHLPATLLLQMHPISRGAVQPYLGAGGNLSFFYARSAGLETLDQSSSASWALQGGVNVKLGTRGALNADLKYLNIDTELSSNGSTVYDLRIRPWVIGAGFGYRF